jgi:LuxR family maltose regulon positive regulatory protein
VVNDKPMVNTQPDEPLYWLAETKFHPPFLREDVIIRRRLIDDLHSKLAVHPLTLLSTPAGYGKTTLLAAFPPTYPDLPIAWLSLDEDDNDPVRFMTALIVALQHLDPSCGAATQSLLTSLPNIAGEVQRVTGVLINDVLETLSDPFVLILDDLHRIAEPGIYAVLDYLLEHLPPQMHLVVATRVDPPLSMARLRARGEVAELRLSELRFSYEETSTFFNDRLRLGLSVAELNHLQSRAEGWAVGLRLFASSLDHINSVEDRKTFIQQLTQTDRNIFDFLAEEVFNRQEAQVRDFLLETAILPELTPTLCRAVTRRANAGTMLEELYRRNLFLVQVAPTQGQGSPETRVSQFDQPRLEAIHPKPETQYRFHDLFAEFLQHKLEEEWPERVPDLHLRAAKAESDPARAVGHFLAAAKWQEAVEIIEQVGAEMFARGYLDTLIRWINKLPASVRESHPRLLHYLSNCAFWKGEWVEVQELLERALQGFEAAGDEAGQGEVLVDLATCAVGQGDLGRSVALHSQALEYSISPHTRVQALLGRALAKGALGDGAQTERDFKAAMALFHPTGKLDPLYLVTLPFFHPDFAFVPGGLEHLERIASQALVQVSDKVSPSRLMAEEMTTILHLFRGQVVEAIRSGERALVLRKRLGGHPYLSLNAALFLAIAYTIRAKYVAVEPLFDVLFLGVDQTGQPTPDLPIYLFYAGRIRWLQGRFQEASEIYAQMRNIMERNPQQAIPEARICCTWMESLLDVAEGRYGEAERVLLQPEILEQKDRGTTVHGSTRLMLARLYYQQNRQREALDELAPVLAYHEQLGIPFAIIVEGQSIVPLLRLAAKEGVHERYATNLLKLLGTKEEPQPVNVNNTGETLTPREVEVLRQIVQGASNHTIAERLVIAESTVKTHIYHIFAKMEVSNRTEAAARSRELGLL